jgi:hypothetical protein
MNGAEVRAVPEMNGFRGEFRKIHRAGWHAVEENGIAQLYGTAEAAENAAYRALMKHIFGDGIVRDGEKASLTKANAEFARIFPGKGRKPVTVERR